MDNRAIVKSQTAEMLDAIELDPRLLMAAKAIQLMQGTDKDGKPNISAEMALAAAIYQAGTGQLVGRDFYVNDKVGRMEGYRGAARDAADRGAGEMQIAYRHLTPDEAEENEVQAGDATYACEVYQLRAWRLAQKLAVEQRMPCQYNPVVGIGIIREVEKYTNTDIWKEAQSGKRYKAGRAPREQWKPIELEGGMTWAKKAKNRAYKDALRHVPGVPATHAEVFEEGALQGAPMPPEGARMTMDQALEWVRQNTPLDVTEGEIVESVTQARAAANVTAMRGPKTNDPFGIDTPPKQAPEPQGTGNAAPTAEEVEAAFNALESALPARHTNGAQSGTQAPAPLPADKRIAPTVVDADVFGDFMTWARRFAEQFPHYSDRGQPDLPHIKRSIAKIGYAKVSGDNFEQIKMEMADRALAAEAAATP